jgi:hypothetical protein
LNEEMPTSWELKRGARKFVRGYGAQLDSGAVVVYIPAFIMRILRREKRKHPTPRKRKLTESERLVKKYAY